MGEGVMFNFEDGTLVLCGAKSKRNHDKPCAQPAMPNGRCRFHGGKCTGPKTLKGLIRSRQANWKHGFYSKEAILERMEIKNLIKHSKKNNIFY